MDLNITYKIQNVRSLNLSQEIEKTRKKINALTHESSDVIFIINAQVGQHKKTVQREFMTCKNGPYITYFNSNSSRAAGVGIAIKLGAKVEVLDIEKDNYDRTLILKTMTNNELITLVAFYDTNENKDNHLNNIETLLRRMDILQGTIIGADFNNFSDNIRDQRGHQARPHYRTKATLKHAQWKQDHRFMDIYRLNYPDGKDLTYIKDGLDRKRIDNGTRLDKFLVTEDLLDKTVEIIHTKDHFYTKEYGMRDNPFDHGSVQLKYNVVRTEAGPGQFKLDPYLVKTGALDSVIKQSIYEANMSNTENQDYIKTN